MGRALGAQERALRLAGTKSCSSSTPSADAMFTSVSVVVEAPNSMPAIVRTETPRS
jgi:hypothetical protein